MDPPLVNEASFSTANPSSYSLAEIWPFQVNNGGDGVSGEKGLRLGPGGVGEGASNRDASVDESTVTEQSGSRGKRGEAGSEDEESKLASISSGHDLVLSCVPFHLDQNNLNTKIMKVPESRSEHCESKGIAEASSRTNEKPAEEAKSSEPPKQDFIHVRARRGQATDSHSLAERARREKISERMKVLQDLVPGCNKIIGKASVLDEIINYIQSLQRQVEFLSMKVEAVNTRLNPAIEAFPAKDLGAPAFDVSGMMYGNHTSRQYAQGPEPEWLHMQLGGSFERGP